MPVGARIRRLDSSVASRVNARRTGRGVDTFWRLFSAGADHGKLWFAVAGVLVALGKPKAAARALASLGVASLVANVVGKRLVGGDRPALESIPFTRRLQRSPTSPSFPSGHTASAVAFATSVALDAPAAGAAVAPLAAAVGYSRLHTGAHWFSDVVGGAAIGAGAAFAVKAAAAGLKAAAPRRTPPTEATIELPALPDGAGAYILVNPGSGRGTGRPDPLPVLRRELPLARLHVLTEHDDIAALIRQRLDGPEPPVVLGVVGGDGTVAAVAHEARRADLPLLVLPGGTFNHFAGGIAVDDLEVGLAALAAGEGRRVDVAELGFADGTARTVLNTFSVGIYPEFVAEREKFEDRWGKPLAALIAAIRIVRRSEPVTLEIDGRRQAVWTVFGGVDRYYPVAAAPIERRRMDDGVLDLRILSARRRPRTSGALALALGGRRDAFVARLPFLQGPPVIDARLVPEVELLPVGGDPGYAHDGETSPRIPGPDDRLRLRLLPAALAVYSPAEPR